MKKVLLFASALCLAHAATAQTDRLTALTAQPGKNTYTASQEETQTTYWQFTADNNYVATVSPLEGRYYSPQVCVVNEAGEEVVLGGVQMAYPKKGYLMLKGQTYYFKMEMRGEDGFNLELEATTDTNVGNDQQNPKELLLGTQQIIGDPNASASDYSQKTCYATFTAQQTGQLRIALSSYIMAAKVGDLSLTPEYDGATGKYLLKTGVEEGKTYAIEFTYTNAFTITTEVVNVVPGSMEAPFDLVEGTNTVPAAKGTYFYTYTPSKAGYFNLTSDAVVPGGQTRIYSSKSDYSYNYQPLASSAKGSYSVRTEVAYTSSTPWLIVIDKLEDSAADDVLNVEMQDYVAGETESNPIALSELPATETLPQAKGTYYYKIVVPGGSNAYLTVECAEALSANTSLKLYRQYNEYNATLMQNGKIKVLANDAYDQTFILKVISDQEKALTFTAGYEQIQQGSIITNPIQAQAADNEIPMDGTVYFAYTATRDGKLSVEVEDDATVTFPMGTSAWAGYYTPIVSGKTYAIEAKAGQTYLICVENAVENTSLYIEETDFEAGEVRQNPIVMEEDTYTFDKRGASNLWLQYNVLNDGILDFACDVPYKGGSDRIEIIKNDDTYGTTMMGTETVGGETTTVFKGKMAVKKGDKLFIHCVLTGTVTGNQISFKEHEAEVGETLANPLELISGMSVEIKNPSFEAPVWVKVALPAGVTELHFTGYLTGDVYTSLEDAQNEMNGGSMYTQMLYGENYIPKYDDNGLPIYEWKQDMVEAGTAYFKFTRTGGDPVVTMRFGNDTPTGVNGIELQTKQETVIYKLDGTRVSKIQGSGIYVIKNGKQTRKVVIK